MTLTTLKKPRFNKKGLGFLLIIIALLLSLPYIFGLIIRYQIKTSIQQFSNPNLSLRWVNYQTGWLNSTATLLVTVVPPGTSTPTRIAINAKIQHGPWLHSEQARAHWGQCLIQLQVNALQNSLLQLLPSTASVDLNLSGYPTFSMSIPKLSYHTPNGQVAFLLSQFQLSLKGSAQQYLTQLMSGTFWYRVPGLTGHLENLQLTNTSQPVSGLWLSNQLVWQSELNQWQIYKQQASLAQLHVSLNSSVHNGTVNLNSIAQAHSLQIGNQIQLGINSQFNAIALPLAGVNALLSGQLTFTWPAHNALEKLSLAQNILSLTQGSHGNFSLQDQSQLKSHSSWQFSEPMQLQLATQTQIPILLLQNCLGFLANAMVWQTPQLQAQYATPDDLTAASSQKVQQFLQNLVDKNILQQTGDNYLYQNQWQIG